jgi:hypothetical protein
MRGDKRDQSCADQVTPRPSVRLRAVTLAGNSLVCAAQQPFTFNVIPHRSSFLKES